MKGNCQKKCNVRGVLFHTHPSNARVNYRRVFAVRALNTNAIGYVLLSWPANHAIEEKGVLAHQAFLTPHRQKKNT